MRVDGHGYRDCVLSASSTAPFCIWCAATSRGQHIHVWVEEKEHITESRKDNRSQVENVRYYRNDNACHHENRMGIAMNRSRRGCNKPADDIIMN